MKHLTLLLLALALALAAQTGCGPAGETPTKITNRTAEPSSQWSNDLFSFAIENLNHLEDNDCEEMWRSTQQRLVALGEEMQAAQISKEGSPEQRLAASQQIKTALGKLPSDALLASWPEPDMLRQVVDRLNQWVDTREKPAAEKPDPMLATLPPELRKLPMVENLDEAHFTPYDGYMLMEAVWARDASKWAGGNTTDELLAARRLFDWTIRNIETDFDNDPERPPQVPWETLFLGRGTTWERAWTYVLLLRQRGIDAAVLALPEDAAAGPLAEKTAKPGDSAPAAEAGRGSLKPWCVAVLIGEQEKKLYLFEPELGLPIPAPGGIDDHGYMVPDKSGQLDVQPATLDQVAADPKLLEQLASGRDKPYWVKAADLGRAVALIEASPLYVSARAGQIQSRLAGEQRLVLNVGASQQAARFKAAGVGDVRLWELPYTTLQHRRALGPLAVWQRLWVYVPFMITAPHTIYAGPVAPLYKGRVMHLKGRLFEENEAVAYYQKARPPTQAVVGELPRIATEWLGALSRHFKPDDRDFTAAESGWLKQKADLQAQQEVSAVLQGKLDASYWLGLIEFDQGQYLSALDYFNVRVLKLDRGLVWAAGAHYNVARSLEAAGQRAKAISEYESIGNPGDLVRARWLRELDSAKERKPEAK
jgi:tetratricopeptide (TPR) repeat protein